MNDALTVLVADDDEDARSIVKLGVEAVGFTAIEARDGLEAVELFTSHHPALAILDMMMPGLSGNEVCTHIKQHERGALVPVIMLTAVDGLQHKVSALERGVDDYLTKPFHLEELQARIKALMRVRELMIRLQEKNDELTAMQEKLVQQERQLLVAQLAGTAAHQLGQPLAAIMLNCHLLEKLPQEDTRYKKALEAVKLDSKRMAELIEKLKTADANKRESYHATTEILDIKS